MSAALQIIGSSPAVPRPNRANSSYLIRTEKSAILLELGSGALAKLLAVQSPAALDAILISHMHADHFFDLVPLRYALKYEVRRQPVLPVFLPPGGTRKLNTVVSSFERSGSFFDGIAAIREYAPDKTLKIGNARITFAKTRHYVNGYGMRVHLPGGVIVFSSDTAPTQNIIELARDADVFLCECGLGADGTESGRRGHSNAQEAGDMAAAAGAKHLVLTHYSASQRATDLKREAKVSFAGKITVADDGMEIPLQ